MKRWIAGLLVAAALAGWADAAQAERYPPQVAKAFAKTCRANKHLPAAKRTAICRCWLGRDEANIPLADLQRMAAALKAKGAAGLDASEKAVFDADTANGRACVLKYKN